MPAPERVPPRGLLTGEDVIRLLTDGELSVRGRLREASNAVLHCEVAQDGRRALCVYKPVAGERPLWDFPDGTLAEREVAAYLVSEATGWGLVPPTVLRDGPFGRGMCQLWIEADPAAGLLALQEGDEAGPGWRAVGPAGLDGGRTALLVHADDVRLRRLAVLDAVINNADRKGGHLLPTADGHLYAIDHGVTFNVEDKLRTLLWGWAGEPLPEDVTAVLERLSEDLAAPSPGPPTRGRGDDEYRGPGADRGPDAGPGQGGDAGAVPGGSDGPVPGPAGRPGTVRRPGPGTGSRPVPGPAPGPDAVPGDAPGDAPAGQCRNGSGRGPDGFREGNAGRAALGARLADLLTAAEVDAVRSRTAGLLATGRHPAPSGTWPPVPWPPI